MSSENNLKKTRHKDRIFYNFGYDFVKVTGALPALIWMRPKVHRPFGKPDTRGGLMISSNHPTFLDPIIALLAFPERRLHCLATKDLFRKERNAFFFKKVHCIIIDKENFNMSSFHEVVERLKEDKAVLIFPEGQVNRDAEAKPLLAFKSGMVLMAHRANVPILPMYIVKKKKWYQRQHIVLGQPVNIAEMLGKMPTMDSLTQVSDLLRDKENELREYFESLPIYEKGWKNK